MNLNTRPWWIKEAIDFLDIKCLDDTMVAYEWGSGGSTPWLARRVASLVSLENDKSWYEAMQPHIEPFDNIELIYCPLKEGYADHILQYPDKTFDLIEVDGPQREKCVPNAIRKLKRNGVFVLDDSQLEEYIEIVALLNAQDWWRYDFDQKEHPFKRTSVWIA